MTSHFRDPRLFRFGPLQMLLALAALLCGLFMYAGVQTAAHNVRLSEERRDVEAEIAVLLAQQAELEGLRSYLGSDEYIEAIARSRFGLVRPGETAVLVDAPLTSEPARQPGERWWEALFDR
uniref:Septum formation initiator n=1 Tax=uncultured Chloroflexi bacterium HF0200_09I09 TaxID=710736 RepID=E0XU82_9CHLR|nr:hypothetical protein [uncultured Chloroflexi bacterium HF0200_09I09]